MTSVLERVRGQVLSELAATDSEYDVGHLDRVAALAGVIVAELGADPVPARVAGYVHHYRRVEEAKRGERPVRTEEARAAALELLVHCQVPQDWHVPVLRVLEPAIGYRTPSAGVDDGWLLAAAVRDADRLDVMDVTGAGGPAAPGPPDQGADIDALPACLDARLELVEGDMLTDPARLMAADRTVLLRRLASGFPRARQAARRPSAAGTTQVSWDPHTSFLTAEEGEQRTDGPLVRVSFRGPVWLTFDEHDRLIGVDLPAPPAALARAVPEGRRHRYPWSTVARKEAMTWRSDLEADWVWISMAAGIAHHRLIGTGDVDVRMRDGKPTALYLHLREDLPEPADTEELSCPT